MQFTLFNKLRAHRRSHTSREGRDFYLVKQTLIEIMGWLFWQANCMDILKKNAESSNKALASLDDCSAKCKVHWPYFNKGCMLQSWRWVLVIPFSCVIDGLYLCVGQAAWGRVGPYWMLDTRSMTRHYTRQRNAMHQCNRLGQHFHWHPQVKSKPTGALCEKMFPVPTRACTSNTFQ